MERNITKTRSFLEDNCMGRVMVFREEYGTGRDRYMELISAAFSFLYFFNILITCMLDGT